MRIALISDIHGNLVALEAVLEHIAAQHVDQIVCLGDVAMSGPQPHEVIERLRDLDCPVVNGNCDELVVKMRERGRMPVAVTGHTGLGAWVVDIDYWSAAQLTPLDVAYLRSLPPDVTLLLDESVHLLCVHGSPRANTDRIMPSTPDDTLDGLLLRVSAPVIAAGHTHVPMVRRYRGVTLINPGSVGLPIVYDPVTGDIYNPLSVAEYALVLWQEGGLDVALERVPVAEHAVRAAAFASGMPHPERWRSSWAKS